MTSGVGDAPRSGDEVSPEEATKTAGPSDGAGDVIPSPLQERDRNRYEIIAEHGRGGLGRVFRARDKELRRPVAIKELLNRSEAAEVRFLREALITASLEHPGIVPVHEAGRWPDGTPFYAMKLVAGRPLSEIIAKLDSPESRRQALLHVIAVADAVAYAHDRSIVHRDLKPSNVIVGDYGETVVIDWGLAKDLRMAEATELGESGAAPDAGLTVAGAVLGTPAYMAPEQARGEAVDARADVYAIGTILREVAGTPDSDLRAIIERCTATKRDDRYGAAGELARDLHAYASGRRISAREYSIPEALSHWVRHHRSTATILAVAVSVVLAATLVAAFRIVRARQRAETARSIAEQALATSEKQRKAALLAQASFLADVDPTEGWNLLVANDLQTADPVLSARLHDFGTALHTISFIQHALSGTKRAGDSHLLVVTGTRELYAVSVETGERWILDRGLDYPPHYYWGDDTIYYVTKRDRSFYLKSTRLNGTPSEITRLERVPLRMIFIDDVAYVFYERTIATEIDLRSGAILRVHNDLSGLVRVGSSLYMSKTDGSLFRIRQGVSTNVGQVDPRHQLTSDQDIGFVIVDEQPVALLTETSIRHIRVRDAEFDGADNKTGSLAGTDEDGNGVIWHADTDEFERFKLPAAYARSGIGVERDLAAWALVDGTVYVRNLETGAFWRIKAQSEPVTQLWLLPSKGLLVTVSAFHIRTWSLRKGTVTAIGRLGATAFFARPGPDADVLLDSRDGGAWLWSPKKGLRSLHKHDAMAFGAAWCGDLACTSHYDGKVICTSPENETSTAIDAPAPMRWIAAYRHDCVYASADGAVGMVRSKQQLFTMPDEPRRACANDDLHMIAAVDFGGSLSLYEADTGRHRSRVAHDGPIWDCAWAGDEIVTYGDEGELRFWTRELAPIRRIALGHAGALVGAKGRVLAYDTNGRVVLVAEGGRIILDLHLTSRFNDLNRMTLSPDGSKIAAPTNSGDVLVIDVATHDVASFHTSPGTILFAAFYSPTQVLTTSNDGELFLIELEPAALP